MAILKSEIIDKVKTNLNAAGLGSNYYSDEDFTDVFLDVYDDIVAQVLPFEKSVNITLTAYKVYYDLYNTIDDYILPAAIYHQDSQRWLTQRSQKYLEGIDSEWEQTKGNPYYYCVIDYRYIAIYPHPTSSGAVMKVFYKYRPPESADADLIPLSSHNDLMFADGMTEDLLAQAGEYQKAGQYFIDYIEAVRKESSLVESRTYPDRILRLSM